MTNTNILINRYDDEETYGERAHVVEMILDRPNKHAVARMHFVIKEGGRASVSLSMGSQVGMAELTKDFINTHKPARLTNQVLKLPELKAMYKAGLRFYARKDHGYKPAPHNLKETIVELMSHSNTGIMMVFES